FGTHLFDTPVDEVLLHLETRDPVAQQTPDAVALLKNRDLVTGAGELLRGGEPRRTRANHRNALAGLGGRRFRLDEAFRKSAVDDVSLDVLDRNRRLVDAKHARGLTRRGAQAPRELGEIVGGV